MNKLSKTVAIVSLSLLATAIIILNILGKLNMGTVPETILLNLAVVMVGWYFLMSFASLFDVAIINEGIEDEKIL